MTDTEKVWKEMENLGWSNIPEGFHLEYFKDIIEATKTALMTSQKSDFISDVRLSLPISDKSGRKRLINILWKQMEDAKSDTMYNFCEKLYDSILNEERQRNEA